MGYSMKSKQAKRLLLVTEKYLFFKYLGDVTVNDETCLLVLQSYSPILIKKILIHKKYTDKLFLSIYDSNAPPKGLSTHQMRSDILCIPHQLKILEQ